jgi:hypothetical protein
MGELKTLKELLEVKTMNGKTGYFVEANEIIQAAIEWVKAINNDRMDIVPKDTKLKDVTISEAEYTACLHMAQTEMWIKHFFSITEEELNKNEER